MASDILKQYAEKVRNGLHIKDNVGVFPHLALGLTGESGEVADIIKKSQYTRSDGIDFDHLVEELGDVQWYLQAFATRLGHTLESLAIKNIEKLSVRRPGVYTPINSVA